MTIRVGDKGRAATVLSPSGMVIVRDRRVSARSNMQLIQAGEEILVLSGDNHGLLVQSIPDNFNPVDLERFGEPVSASFGDAVQTKTALKVAERRAWMMQRKRVLSRMGLSLGMIFGLIEFVLCWDHFSAISPIPVPWIGLLMVSVAAILGLWLTRFVENTLRAVDHRLHRMTFVATALALTGTVIGGWWGLTSVSLPGGIVGALIGAAITGLPLPIAAILISSGVEDSEVSVNAEGSAGE